MEILVIIVLIMTGGFFAMTEIALISSRKTRLQEKAKTGNTSAIEAVTLANNPERFLSTVQIFITLIGDLVGVFGGSQLTDKWTESIKGWHIAFLDGREHNIALALIVTFITFLSLVIGELAPKYIGMSNPEGITIRFAKLMRFFSKAAHPIVVVLEWAANLILKLFGIKPSDDPPITEEELKVMIETGSRHGIIEEEETEIIKSALRFGDRTVESLMTHRSEIVWLDIHETKEEVKNIVYTHTYNHFPVCEDTLENILGIVSINEVLALVDINNDTIDLKSVMHQPIYIHESMEALKLIEEFKKAKVYCAIVIDEYGEPQGIVTVYDIIESIFGEMPDATDPEFEETVFLREDGSLLIDGMMQLDELKEELSLERLRLDDIGNYKTLAGFVMHQLGRLPKLGDKFLYDGYSFEIVDMDIMRVDKVLITKLDKTREE